MTSIIKLANLFLLLMACEIVSSENIRTGFNKFVSYYVGNMNLIITAPHGGYLKVGSPPRSTCHSLSFYICTYVHHIFLHNTPHTYIYPLHMYSPIHHIFVHKKPTSSDISTTYIPPSQPPISSYIYS